jgi:hypothetical protein
MANTLSLAEWKKILKAHPDAADAAPLTKALEVYDKAEGKDDPKLLLDAIEKVLSSAQAAKKKNAKNKEVVKFLDLLTADADKEKAKAARSEKQQQETEGDEEEESGGAALKAQLVRVKKLDAEKASPFVLALGQVCGLAIARRPPISKDHREAARALRTGKGKLLTGRCYGEGAKYVFEFEDRPPGGLTKLIKKAARIHTGMEIRLKVRGGGEELDDETDLAELTDFGVETPEGAPAPGVEGEAPTPPPTDEAQRFIRQAQAVKGEFERLVKIDAPRAAPLRDELAAALRLGQEKRYAEALLALEAFAVKVRAALREAETPAPTTSPSPAAQVLARLSELTPAIQQAIAAAPDKKAPLLKLVAKVKDDAKAGKVDAASAALRALEQFLPARTAGARPGEGASVAKILEARDRWQTAKASTDSGLNRLQTALRARSNPRLHRIAEFGFHGVTAGLQVGVAAALIDCERSSWTDPKINAKAAQAIVGVTRFLESNPMVALCDDNPFGVNVGLRTTLLPTLTEFAATLGS